MEKSISVYWFAILIIVAGGIVFMVLHFYGKPYDVREIEAGILTENIADCISSKGTISFKIGEQEFADNFMKACHLNFDSQDGEVQYYAEIAFYDFNNQAQKLGREIKAGNPNLNGNLNSNSLYASTKSIYILNADGESPLEILANITTIIKKTEQNG